jgi:hypothetical protein
MRPLRHGLLVFALACAADNAAPRQPDSTPARGGTLRVVSPDVNWWPPQCCALMSDPALHHLWTRQLLSYASDTSFAAATTLVPDGARDVPTRMNGGISAEGRVTPSTCARVFSGTRTLHAKSLPAIMRAHSGCCATRTNRWGARTTTTR